MKTGNQRILPTCVAVENPPGGRSARRRVTTNFPTGWAPATARCRPASASAWLVPARRHPPTRQRRHRAGVALNAMICKASERNRVHQVVQRAVLHRQPAILHHHRKRRCPPTGNSGLVRVSVSTTSTSSTIRMRSCSRRSTALVSMPGDVPRLGVASYQGASHRSARPQRRRAGDHARRGARKNCCATSRNAVRRKAAHGLRRGQPSEPAVRKPDQTSARSNSSQRPGVDGGPGRRLTGPARQVDRPCWRPDSSVAARPRCSSSTVSAGAWVPSPCRTVAYHRRTARAGQSSPGREAVACRYSIKRSSARINAGGKCLLRQRVQLVPLFLAQAVAGTAGGSAARRSRSSLVAPTPGRTRRACHELVEVPLRIFTAGVLSTGR